MPAFVKRIIVLLLTVTAVVFGYEYHYVSNTVTTIGIIESIVHKGRGKAMSIGFVILNGGRSAFTTNILIIDEFTEKYHVGDRVPVAYCSDCYPVAKIEAWTYLYTLTIMLVMLDLIMVVVLGIVGWRRWRAESGFG